MSNEGKKKREQCSWVCVRHTWKQVELVCLLACSAVGAAVFLFEFLWWTMEQTRVSSADSHWYAPTSATWSTGDERYKVEWLHRQRYIVFDGIAKQKAVVSSFTQPRRPLLFIQFESAFLSFSLSPLLSISISYQHCFWCSVWSCGCRINCNPEYVLSKWNCSYVATYSELSAPRATHTYVAHGICTMSNLCDVRKYRRQMPASMLMAYDWWKSHTRMCNWNHVAFGVVHTHTCETSCSHHEQTQQFCFFSFNW